jgi:hypothetical protein
MEILLNTNDSISGDDNRDTLGTPSSWQMVFNLHKSRLAGIGYPGGLLEGETRVFLLFLSCLCVLFCLCVSCFDVILANSLQPSQVALSQLRLPRRPA